MILLMAIQETSTSLAGQDADAPQSSSLAGAIPFRTVGFNLSSLGYAVSRRFRQTLAPLDLEPREFSLLRAVAAAEGQSQQAIGEALQIPASRMVAFVDALEARHLLERRTNPQDRRARALHLTPDGHQLLSSAMNAAIGLEQELCAAFSAKERDLLLDLLQRVGEQLGLHSEGQATHAHSALSEEIGPDGACRGGPPGGSAGSERAD
jgi:DNA-binding MarR family transcriptional regulator